MFVISNSLRSRLRPIAQSIATHCSILRFRNTIEFPGIWETLYNPEFKPLEFERFRKEADLNAFTLRRNGLAYIRHNSHPLPQQLLYRPQQSREPPQGDSLRRLSWFNHLIVLPNKVSLILKCKKSGRHGL
jgi:hypothetical protein